MFIHLNIALIINEYIARTVKNIRSFSQDKTKYHGNKIHPRKKNVFAHLLKKKKNPCSSQPGRRGRHIHVFIPNQICRHRQKMHILFSPMATQRHRHDFA